MPTSAIVVGVDLSDCSRRAVEAASRLASDLGASIVLVHAYSRVPGRTFGQDAANDPLGQLKAEIDMDESVDISTELAGMVRADGVEVEIVADTAAPADLILKVAQEHSAAFIVVGTEGFGGLKRLVLGSTAQDVVRRADRPVLVVPARMADH